MCIKNPVCDFLLNIINHMCFIALCKHTLKEKMIFTQNDHPYLHPYMFYSLIRFTVIGTRRASGHYCTPVCSGVEGQFKRRNQSFCRSVITCILFVFHVRLNHAGQQTLQQQHRVYISAVFCDGDFRGEFDFFVNAIGIYYGFDVYV